MTSTKIEWADVVWNPVVGCSRVSEGCRNCYAERMAFRLAKMGKRGYADVAEKKGWTGKVNVLYSKLEDPLLWGKPKRVFVNSMSDLFHEQVPFAFILQVFAVMEKAKQHTFMVLTKRPARMVEFFGWASTQWPLPKNFPAPENVMLGVSAENQKTFDERYPLLLQTPAAMRFVSFEPLLGPIDVRGQYPWKFEMGEPGGDPPWRFWAIVGGESGPKARPMHGDWARGIRDACVEAGVPFFFKQWGEWRAEHKGQDFEATCAVCGCTEDNPCPGGCWWDGGEREDEDMRDRCSSCTGVIGHRWVDGSYSYRLGKKLAGRLLDEHAWNQRPRLVGGEA